MGDREQRRGNASKSANERNRETDERLERTNEQIGCEKICDNITFPLSIQLVSTGALVQNPFEAFGDSRRRRRGFRA